MAARSASGTLSRSSTTAAAIGGNSAILAWPGGRATLLPTALLRGGAAEDRLELRDLAPRARVGADRDHVVIPFVAAGIARGFDRHYSVKAITRQIRKRCRRLHARFTVRLPADREADIVRCEVIIVDGLHNI